MPAKRNIKHYLSAIRRAEETIELDGGAEDYLESLARTPRELGLLYAAYVCQDEVSGGGFEQYFFGGAGVSAPEALEGFSAIGQASVASLLKGAMELFGGEYPRERLDRVEILDGMDGGTADTLMALEENFLDMALKEAGGFEAAAEQYAAAILGGKS